MNYLKAYNFPIGVIFHPKNQKEILLYTNYDITKVSYNNNPQKEAKFIGKTAPDTINFLQKNQRNSF